MLKTILILVLSILVINIEDSWRDVTAASVGVDHQQHRNGIEESDSPGKDQPRVLRRSKRDGSARLTHEDDEFAPTNLMKRKEESIRVRRSPGQEDALISN